MVEVSRKNILFFVGAFCLLSTLGQVPTYVLAIRGPPGSEVVFAQMLFPPPGARAVPISRTPADEVELKRRRRRRNANNLAMHKHLGQPHARLPQSGSQRRPGSTIQRIARMFRPGRR
ncbi:uncharacterized protein LOC119402857 [Rhipicephalus sanguineus]|uniref:uncharacterized protein LOC119402857 n=1 Tax=Rhipicephalus sanguineus TaxID=34632 RepID=UPI001895FA29|nr:uncharacterized protein LOC119402857 [Rhipicephalus sanguineus]